MLAKDASKIKHFFNVRILLCFQVDKMDFGNLISASRKKYGLRQEDCKEKFKMTLTTLQKWERGESEPNIHNIGGLIKLTYEKADVVMKKMNLTISDVKKWIWCAENADMEDREAFEREIYQDAEAVVDPSSEKDGTTCRPPKNNLA